jgi:hypothetical protein
MAELRARQVFQDAGRLIIAVEQRELRQRNSRASWQLYGTLEPVAVIVCEPDGVYALDMALQPLAVAELTAQIPELATLLAAFN